ncbi:MAG: indole-3-glycerol phosphate synthase TrpC [Spirochaetaceae bacterium]|nr:indole-3-glycerol phosphate synthase TrpC [Spirochaetaceae bacterium]
MFLDKIKNAVRIETDRSKHGLPAAAVHSFFDALCMPGLSFICELKKASPSKGIICEDYKPAEFARDYQTAGAAAISVLTEKNFFLGGIEDLKTVRAATNLPVLRKDFIIDEFQIFEARIFGADAILLIAALLDVKKLSAFIKLAKSLNLDALVEVHNKAELEAALKAEAKIIGINNRDLVSFEVRLETSFELSDYLFNKLNQKLPLVAESGIKKPEETQLLSEAGFDAVLVGETLMRAKDKKAMINYLKGI